VEKASAQRREAGVLLPLSSVASSYGIGSMGRAARDWAAFLAGAGQRAWQMLPLGPTGWGDSPYQSFSAFAISPYYIDIDALAARGLLDAAEVAAANWGADPGRVDYAALYRGRRPLLERAFRREAERGGNAAFDAFFEENRHWLEDYALFMAIKDSRRGESWLEWPDPLRLRESAALAEAKSRLAAEIRYHEHTQAEAFSQAAALRRHAASLGVSLIGDLPIYVALDSADAWSHPEFFQFDQDRRPHRVAGCPPDPFAAGGQLWGNPLYDWAALARDGYRWWLERLESSFQIFDVVRIDHFRGFESYFSIPAGAADALGGAWVKGPGLDFIEALRRAFPNAKIIAEDLGYLTSEVRALLGRSGFPGMKILQFAFDSREPGNYMPYTYPANSVAYTGTHDNPTSLGWYETASEEDKALARDFLGFDGAGDVSEAFVRAALASASNLAVIPFQDWLGLGRDARINTPSTLGGGNWTWRLTPAAAKLPEAEPLARRMSRLAAVTGR